ncbi:AAA family ATPase [Saccharothrix xinjiangensis]|uniref:AAA family ATPase n=1 Tax=Saccharothrix xinjiangensis TaxID=204798 RepID=A0ABV9Y054_9PSEU
MTPFERESEVDLIADALRRAGAGAGSLVVVRGPMGIGRSALLHRALALATEAGGAVLRARAAPAERGFDHGVVRQLLEPVPRVDVEPHPSPLFAGEAPPTPHELFHRFRAEVRDLSRERPVLVAVDDVQWADPPSLACLAYLGRRLGPLRAVLLVSLLDGDRGAELPAAIDLVRAARAVLRPKPLSTAGARALLAGRRGGPVDEQHAREWRRHTGGIPLLLHALPSGPDDGDPGSWPVADLSEVVGRCLRLQPGRVGATADALAVLDSPADPDLVRRLAGLDEVDVAEAVRALRALGLLAPGADLAFTAPVLRRAVRGAMAAATREELELRAARALYGSGEVERAADHLVATTTPAGEWAANVLRAAATTAMVGGDAPSAVRYLRRALLDGSPDGPDRGRLLADLAAVELDHDLVSAVRHAHQALPLLPSAVERASALCLTPVVPALGGTPRLEEVRSVAAELGPADRLTGLEREMALKLEARLRLAGQEDPAQLADAHERFLALGPRPPLDSPGERELCAVLLHAGALTGRVEPGALAELGNRVLAREPAAASRAWATPGVLTTTLVAAESVGELGRWLDAATEDGLAHRRVLPLVAVRTRQALVALVTGRLVEARDLARRTIAEVDPALVEVISTCAVVLCAAAVELREPELARYALSRCPTRAENSRLASLTGLLRGSAAVAAGDLSVAVEHFADLGRHVDRIGWRNGVLFPWRSRLVTLHARLGNTELARGLNEEDLAEARRGGVAGPIGRALRQRGALVGGRAGITALKDAVDVLAPSTNRVELAKARALLGRRLREAGDDAATAHLREARHLALACGMTWLADRAGAAPGPRPGDGRRADLTSTERRVVELVIDGHRNKDIADRLGVGARAVEKHLTSAYRKLGVRGRSELAGAVPPPGADGWSRGSRAG